MRFFAVIALAAAASAHAVSLNRRQSFPACSNSCLANADFGSCDPLDDSCLCKSQSFVSSVTNCIVGACQGSDLTNAEAAAQQLCLAVGVTLTSTPAAQSTATAASSSGAAAGSASATQTSASSASSATSTGSSNSAASHGVNALAALAAVGAAALVL